MLGQGAYASAPHLSTEEFNVPTEDAGVNLYVRNKHPSGLKQVAGNRIVLFVHGSTWPSEVTFDLRLNGLSWMDYIAQAGYDVYLVDVRG